MKMLELFQGMQQFNSSSVTAMCRSQITSIFIFVYNSIKHAMDELTLKFFSISGWLCLEGNVILMVEELQFVEIEYPDAVH